MTDLRSIAKPLQMLFLLSLGAIGCGSHKSAALAPGYLATDACSQTTDATACGALSGCSWVGVTLVDNGPGTASPPVEGPPPVGACVANDPCLALGKTDCASNGACAWSAVTSLCPIGATCTDGGFCHAKADDGTDCACVTPLSSNSDGTTPSVECDCSAGGSTGGSGGACTCACAPCAAGETCKPCDCNCDSGGSGCTQPGTCVCDCPACPEGADCAPCACDCSNGGGVTVSGGDACGVHKDQASCLADTANACSYLEVPCTEGSTDCSVCERTSAQTTTGTTTTICNCPECPAGSACAPCGCAADGPTSGGTTTGGGMNNGCVPPALPTTPVVCPALGCQPACSDGGVAIDANGCPTCSCKN